MRLPNLITVARRETIIKLAKEGLPPVQISALLNGAVPLGTIYKLLSMARRAGHDIQRFPTVAGARSGKRPDAVVRLVLWDSADIDPLDRAAVARGITRSEIVKRIVSIAARDELIDAILDDGKVSS